MGGGLIMLWLTRQTKLLKRPDHQPLDSGEICCYELSDEGRDLT